MSDFTRVNLLKLNKDARLAYQQYKKHCGGVPRAGEKTYQEEQEARQEFLDIVAHGDFFNLPDLETMGKTDLSNYVRYLIQQEKDAQYCAKFREDYKNYHVALNRWHQGHDDEIDRVKVYLEIVNAELLRVETYMEDKSSKNQATPLKLPSPNELPKKKKHQKHKKKKKKKKQRKSFVGGEHDEKSYTKLITNIKKYERDLIEARNNYIIIMWDLIDDMVNGVCPSDEAKLITQQWIHTQEYLNVGADKIIMQLIYLMTFILFGENLDDMLIKKGSYSTNFGWTKEELYEQFVLPVWWKVKDDPTRVFYSHELPEKDEHKVQLEVSCIRWMRYISFCLNLIMLYSYPPDKNIINPPSFSCEAFLDEKKCNTHIKNCQWKVSWDRRIAVSDYSPVKGCSSRFGCKYLNKIECNKLTNKNCRWKDDRNECWNFEPRRELAKNSDLIGLKISWGEGGKSGKLFGDERVFHFKFPFADDFRRWQKSSPEIFLNGIVVDKTRKIGELLTYFIFWITDGKKLYLPSKDKNKKEWAFKKKDKFLNKNVQIKDQLVNNDHIYLALRKKK